MSHVDLFFTPRAYNRIIVQQFFYADCWNLVAVCVSPSYTEYFESLDFFYGSFLFRVLSVSVFTCGEVWKLGELACHKRLFNPPPQFSRLGTSCLCLCVCVCVFVVCLVFVFEWRVCVCGSDGVCVCVWWGGGGGGGCSGVFYS